MPVTTPRRTCLQLISTATLASRMETTTVWPPSTPVHTNSRLHPFRQCLCPRRLLRSHHSWLRPLAHHRRPRYYIQVAQMYLLAVLPRADHSYRQTNVPRLSPPDRAASLMSCSVLLAGASQPGR